MSQYVALKTIVRKEVTRFCRIWTQTLIPPMMTQSLYFLIFGKFIGSQISQIHGVSYMAFIVPGLVMMSVINNSYSNVSSSFFSSKFQRSIEELMVSPVEEWVVICGYAIGGALRGICVGSLVFFVSFFFVRPQIVHGGIIIVFMVLTSVVFALGGLVNAIFAKSFDDIGIVPMFIITPLTYLGGVFYSIKSLSPFWQAFSRFNPVLYLVNGFRYGFYGISDVEVWVSIVMLCACVTILFLVNLFLLRKGYGLRS